MDGNTRAWKRFAVASFMKSKTDPIPGLRRNVAIHAQALFRLRPDFERCHLKIHPSIRVQVIGYDIAAVLGQAHPHQGRRFQK
jgi:hypothetical protein